jgi:hypothetical protein
MADDPIDLRRILSTRHGPAVTARIFEHAGEAMLRYPMHPYAGVAGAAVGMIVGRFDQRRAKATADLLTACDLRLEVATSIDDLQIDDSLIEQDQADRALITQAVVDQMVAATEVQMVGATVTTSTGPGLSAADLRRAFDLAKALDPPWSIFRDQVDVDPSPWVAADTGAYVIDTDAIEWLVDEPRKRYRVLVRSDVLAQFEAAGIHRQEVGAMIVWKVRKDRIDQHGEEAWPLP